MNRENRTHVLFVTTGLGSGGAEMMLCNIIAGLDPLRFRSSVISLTAGGKHEEILRRRGVGLASLGMRPGRPSPAALWRLARLLRAAKPDVIAGWMYHGCLAALLGKWLSLSRAPVVWNIRQSLDAIEREKPGSAAVIRLLARLSRFPDAITYNSRASIGHHEAIGYRSHRSLLIPNGLDSADFHPSDEARRSVRAELGLGAETPLVGRIGRFAPMKDHATFVAAGPSILAARPDAHFLMAGTGVEPANEELGRAIAALGLGSRFHLLGERHDLPRITAALDVACSSSAFGEGFPNVIGEAMACAVPCAVTDVGDSAWVVGGCGRVVPPRDAAALAGAIAGLLSLPAAERRALGAASRERIAQHFSLSAAVSRFEDLLARPSAAIQPPALGQPCAE